jgi:hypothetical protein
MSFTSLAVVALLASGLAQNPAPSQAPDESTARSAAAPAAATAAAPAPAPAESTSLNPNAIGVSLDKIQKAVTRPAAIKLNEERPVFRMEIFGRTPSIEDILGKDYLRGPVPYGVMSHQEFLNMVTPKDVQGYAAFSNSQGMIVAAESVALQWAVLQAIDKLKSVKSDRAKEAARKEVEDAMEALRRARREAGLPDK